MSDETPINQFSKIIAQSNKILVIQADNPDADSLGSALALEQILEEMGKQVYLYCGIDIPQYLHHMSGWDRVMNLVPSQFDSSIVVDTSALSLLQRLTDSGHQGWIASKPCVILDHHLDTENNIPFASLTINEPGRSSTGELIYSLARELSWKVDVTAAEYIAGAILGDSQGLTNESATSETYRIMAELIDIGVSRPGLEEIRREYTKMDPRIFKYKAELIDRTELLADGRLALVTIPQTEISTYSPLYNPAPLIQSDMLQTVGVMIAVVIKHYDDGKILASIRCNSPAPIAGDLATHFGGGGHAHASGFKIINGKPINEVKSECIEYTTQLLDNLNS